MAKKALQKEIEGWLEEVDEEHQDAFLELQDVTDDQIKMNIGEEEHMFSITFPKSYPKESDEQFFFFSEEPSLSNWTSHMNHFAEKRGVKMSDLLAEAAEFFISSTGKEEEQEEDLEDDDGFTFETKEEKPKPKKTKEEQEIDEKMNRGEFLEIGSPQATLRLIKDLKNLRKTKPELLGFTADPVIEQKGLENLYHWHVKLFSTDKDSDLYKDMQVYKQKSGQDHILLEMRFSSDYPHVPPFIRVVRPRFAFRTGHVTIGGSICMQLLTKSGWSSINDIESILIQIAAELVSGGARLDPGMNKNYEYNEHEAWDAFYRAARTHGWNVDGLSSSMFPKVPTF